MNFNKDFSAKVIKGLTKRGIRVIGPVALPDASGSFLNSERGYSLDAKGTHIVRTYWQVVALGDPFDAHARKLAAN